MKILFACLFICSTALAQEPTHPALGATHHPRFEMFVNVIDINATVAAAELILTTKYGLTAEEAHEKILSGGEIDLARCIEYIMHNALNSILTPSLEVTEVIIEQSHP